MLLDAIVTHKRHEIAVRARRRPADDFAGRLTPSTRSLAAAVARPGARFIFEYKTASPSAGTLREDLTPEAAADAFAGVADAISVVTDFRFFDGAPEDLARVRARVDCPLLAKDIVVDPYQLFEARHFGADAVLLMLSVLGDDDYRACTQVAARLGLDIVTEVHDEAELARALALDARIIGINNRNLHDFSVDLGVTRRLARRLPADRLVISESGIEGPGDVRRLARHVDAFLIGTAVMTAPRPDLAARQMVFGRVKVCGHRAPESLARAHAAGASWGGLVFAPHSRRRVSRVEARALATTSPLPLVGVFVNEPVERVTAIAAELGLAAVQLHGDEPRTYRRELRRHLDDTCALWQAVRVRRDPPERLPAEADRVVLDGFVPAVWGGTGRRFDWRDLALRRDKRRIILAGGLEAGCAARAAALGTWALDVSTGVERMPGLKDADLLSRFFAALRPPDRRQWYRRDAA